jgi:hypothetical protein
VPWAMKEIIAANYKQNKVQISSHRMSMPHSCGWRYVVGRVVLDTPQNVGNLAFRGKTSKIEQAFF